MVARVCGMLAFAIPMGCLANPTNRPPNERAQRDAENPLRVIIEASKLPRKPAVDTPAVVVPSPGTGRKLQAVPVARPEAGKGGSASAPALAKPVAGSASAAQVKNRLDAASDVDATVDARQAPSEGGIKTAVSPLAAYPTEEKPVPEKAAGPGIRLLHMVEPEVPEHLWQRLGKNAELKVRLWIEVDGQVSDVRLESPAAEGIEPLVKSALMRWRFSELARATQAAITLVFRREDP